MTAKPLHADQTDAFEETFSKLIAAHIKQYISHVPPEAMLVIFSRFVGMILAMQDPNKLTAENALAVVSLNIADGNDLACRSGKAQGRR